MTKMTTVMMMLIQLAVRYGYQKKGAFRHQSFVVENNWWCCNNWYISTQLDKHSPFIIII